MIHLVLEAAEGERGGGDGDREMVNGLSYREEGVGDGCRLSLPLALSGHGQRLLSLRSGL